MRDNAEISPDIRIIRIYDENSPTFPERYTRIMKSIEI
jgi:hypothetical protein